MNEPRECLTDPAYSLHPIGNTGFSIVWDGEDKDTALVQSSMKTEDAADKEYNLVIMGIELMVLAAFQGGIDVFSSTFEDVIASATYALSEVELNQEDRQLIELIKSKKGLE